MNMQEYISQRLEDISDPRNRELMRQISESVLLPLFSYTEQKYIDLEERVKSELPAPNQCFTIRSTLIPKSKVNAYSSWLFPILPEDPEDHSISLQDILEIDTDSNAGSLGTLFLEADYLDCQRFELDNEMFHGKLVGERIEIPVDVKLRPSKRYIYRVKGLYKHFLSNGIPWITANIPYIHKLYEAWPVSPIELDDAPDTPVKLEIVYGKWDTKLKRNLVPVWNIEHILVEGDSFPLPALDKLNYEYRFSYPESGADDGYLANYRSADISAARREKDAFIVTSPVSKGLEWELCRFHQRPISAMEHFPCPIFDNRQYDSFAGRMASHYGVMLQTRAELSRILNSFESADGIHLDSFEVLSQIIKGETYEVNSFIMNEVRDVEAKKSLLLRYRPKKKDYIFNRDLASFLTSQAQLMYPEFHCVGVLV